MVFTFKSTDFYFIVKKNIYPNDIWEKNIVRSLQLTFFSYLPFFISCKYPTLFKSLGEKGETKFDSAHTCPVLKNNSQW